MKKLQKIILISSIISLLLILIIAMLITNLKSNNVTQIAKVEESIPKQSTNATVGAESELSKFVYTISENNIILKRYTGTASNLTIYSKYTKSGTQYNTVMDKEYVAFTTGSSNLRNVIIQDGVKVRIISDMFRECSTLETATIGNINITKMEGMFKNCDNLKSVDFSNCDTSNVTTMKYMFYDCTSLTSINLSTFNTSNVTDMSLMFSGCTNLTSINLSSFNTSNLTNMSGMFSDCSNLTNINISNFDTRNVTTMGGMFRRCSNLTSIDLSNFNTSNVETMSGMFYECTSLTSLNLSNFDTRNVTTMGSMFYECTSLTSLNISNFNTSSVTSMERMFNNCNNLTNINVSNFDTRNVTTMYAMFSGCKLVTSLNVDNFNTSNVTNMRDLFCGCKNLTNLNLKKWNTSNVTTMQRMFVSCESLTELDLTNFNTSKVTDMWGMFNGCSGLTSLNLSGWDVSKVTSIEYFLNNCDQLQIINLSGWDTSNITSFYLYGMTITDIYTPNKGNIFIAEWYYNDSNVNDDNTYGRNVDLSIFNNKSVHLVKSRNNIFYYVNGGTGSTIVQAKKPGIASTIRNNTFTGPDNKEFIGWDTSYSGKGTTYMPGDSYTTDSSLTLYAQWEKDEYTVTYNANGGTGNMSSTTHTVGVASNLRKNTYTKTGYRFIGWALEEHKDGLTADYADEASVTNLGESGETVELYAVWETEQYNITYVLDGGAIGDTNYATAYTYGIGATLPINVRKQGYVFRGWYKEEDYSGTQVTSIGIAETGDKTYYAKLLVDTDEDGIPDEEDEETLVKYTVEYYKQNLAQNGYDEPERIELQGNLGTKVIAEVKTYTGFRENNQAPLRVPEGIVLVDESLVLKLYYDREQYNITYVLDGGAIQDTNYATAYTYGIGANLPTNVRKQGYVFRGWYENSDFTGVAITSIETTQTGAKTYYAKWLVDTDGDGIPDEEDEETLVKYTVEYYKQNLAQNGYDEPERVELQGNLGTKVIAEVKTYTGFRENDQAPLRVPEGIVLVDESLVLKLYYDREQYNITYVLDGGAIGDANYATTYTYGIGANLPTNVTKQGYTFRGWYENSDFTGNIITSIEATQTGAKTYYAKWTADGNTTYTIEYYKENLTQNGYVLEETKTLPSITGTKVIAEETTYIGFRENKQASQRISEGIVKADGSLVLKLYYNREIYNITYVVDGGTIEDTNYATQYKYGIETTLPINVTKEGYIFAGWYEEEKTRSLSTTRITKTGTEDTGDKTYYAKWTKTEEKKKIYKIEHYVQNKETYELKEVEEIEEIVGQNVVAKAKEYEAYVFDEANENNVLNGIVKENEETILKVYYKIKKITVIIKDGDVILDKQVIDYGTKPIFPGLTKPGYILNWKEEKDEETGEIIYTVVWTKDPNYKKPNEGQNNNNNKPEETPKELPKTGEQAVGVASAVLMTTLTASGAETLILYNRLKKAKLYESMKQKLKIM